MFLKNLFNCILMCWTECNQRQLRPIPPTCMYLVYLYQIIPVNYLHIFYLVIQIFFTFEVYSGIYCSDTVKMKKKMIANHCCSMPGVHHVSKISLLTLPREVLLPLLTMNVPLKWRLKKLWFLNQTFRMFSSHWTNRPLVPIENIIFSGGRNVLK